MWLTDGLCGADQMGWTRGADETWRQLDTRLNYWYQSQDRCPAQSLWDLLAPRVSP